MEILPDPLQRLPLLICGNDRQPQVELASACLLFGLFKTKPELSSPRLDLSRFKIKQAEACSTCSLSAGRGIASDSSGYCPDRANPFGPLFCSVGYVPVSRSAIQTGHQ